MNTALVWDPALATYRFGKNHPMKPERFTLAVDLMRAWNLLCDEPATGPCAAIWQPEPATNEDLLLFHTPELIAAVKLAGSDPTLADARHGLGNSDTPAFPDMHSAAALAVGATTMATLGVLDGRATRAFNPAGGLHHAHADRVAGFCIYNDCAIAIMRATAAHPGLKVAYVDIDAHHGDGVQEAFYARNDVLTLSVHESGSYLYPGTGHPSETGEGDGDGYTLNMPLPPDSTDACFALVLERVIAPALRAFRPDLIMLQGGGDTHRDDPLTHLEATVAGYTDLVGGIVGLADELCEGRLVMTGGGGYEAFSAVPRMWACAMAELLDADTPPFLPAAWYARVLTAKPDTSLLTFDEPSPGSTEGQEQDAIIVTARVIAGLESTHPLLDSR